MTNIYYRTWQVPLNEINTCPLEFQGSALVRGGCRDVPDDDGERHVLRDTAGAVGNHRARICVVQHLPTMGAVITALRLMFFMFSVIENERRGC